MENERYKRNGDLVPNMKEKSVLVAGTGGSGTWVSTQLAMLGVGKIYLADDDTVSLNNLNRQLFVGGEEDVNKPKVSVLSKFLKNFNKDIEIFEVKERIENEAQIPKVDYIFCCVDNLKARALLSEYAEKEGNVVVFDAGIPDKEPLKCTLQSYTSNPKFIKSSFKDFCPDYKKLIEKEAKAPHCTENPEPNIVTTNSIMATLMIYYFIKTENLLKTSKTKINFNKDMLLLDMSGRPDFNYFEVVKVKK